MQKVGFIGLGLMGAPMAENILRAGYPLTVFNRSAAKAEPLKKQGAQVADKPRGVAESSDVIITMLSDASAVQEVLVGEGGVLAGAKKGGVLIDMSTVAPDQSRAIAGQLAQHGMKMLDAPVYGSTGPAKEGTLGIMVGGDKDVFEAHQDLLGVMGKHIYYMGPQGSGATVKLCFNLMIAAQMISLAEALTLAAKGGVDLKLVAEVITGTAVNSNLIERKIQNMTAGSFPPAFPLKHMHKDLGLIVHTAQVLDASLPATGVALELYTAAKARGHAEEDFSAIHTLLAELAGMSP